jgi:hypothetical protein
MSSFRGKNINQFGITAYKYQRQFMSNGMQWYAMAYNGHWILLKVYHGNGHGDEAPRCSRVSSLGRISR